ncbi:shikimate kinase [Nesterenkonia flava]|uniref:Shikimate kinase n=1 Tax=Nesterenkonia flava TaxID=469799 RepID=A0ABU1FPQ6_9MICC|nr:shikimate kinase [Nesterenkonia flava]MDR5710634.1 shikimate kinase [Nesterenkonia flava]
MRNIVLIGPMGSGKSTVGAALARKMGRPHVDTDHFFAARHGSIPEFFAEHGEEAFRAEEEKIVAELCDSPRPSVISLGGGAILSRATREVIASHWVVMLDATADQVVARIGDASTRPMLKDTSLGEDPAAVWQRIYQEREPLYRQCADYIMEPADMSIETRADTIITAFHQDTQRTGT